MVITNWKHPDVRRILRLRDRRERDRSGLFLAEGIRFLIQGADAGWPLEALVVCPRMLTNGVAQMVSRRLARSGADLIRVTPEVFETLSLAESPQGVAVVARQRIEALDPVAAAPGACWVGLETIRSPGNLGTILRTSDAAGGQGALLVGPEADPYDPAVVRATMGAIFTQQIVRTDVAGLRRWKRRCGVTAVGTSPHADLDFREAAYRTPSVILMGCERHGLSPALLGLCDDAVRIPMVGRADSLNVAVAAGLLLYEARRSSLPRGGVAPALTKG